MEIKTLDERIRQRGRDEWSKRVRDLAAEVNRLACGEFRCERMEIKTTEQNGVRVTTIWQCIERLFEAIEAAGNEKAGDEAVAEFLKRFDGVAADLDELRSEVAGEWHAFTV